MAPSSQVIKVVRRDAGIASGAAVPAVWPHILLVLCFPKLEMGDVALHRLRGVQSYKSVQERPTSAVENRDKVFEPLVRGGMHCPAAFSGEDEDRQQRHGRESLFS